MFNETMMKLIFQQMGVDPEAVKQQISASAAMFNILCQQIAAIFTRSARMEEKLDLLLKHYNIQYPPQPQITQHVSQPIN